MEYNDLIYIWRNLQRAISSPVVSCSKTIQWLEDTLRSNDPLYVHDGCLRLVRKSGLNDRLLTAIQVAEEGMYKIMTHLLINPQVNLEYALKNVTTYKRCKKLCEFTRSCILLDSALAEYSASRKEWNDAVYEWKEYTRYWKRVHEFRIRKDKSDKKSRDAAKRHTHYIK